MKMNVKFGTDNFDTSLGTFLTNKIESKPEIEKQNYTRK
jgi:hypothetical protein